MVSMSRTCAGCISVSSEYVEEVKMDVSIFTSQKCFKHSTHLGEC